MDHFNSSFLIIIAGIAVSPYSSLGSSSKEFSFLKSKYCILFDTCEVLFKKYQNLDLIIQLIEI